MDVRNPVLIILLVLVLLVAGHQRIKSCQAIGINHTPVV